MSRAEVLMPPAARPVPTQRPPRLAMLDGLRLVAALAVVLCHYAASWRIDGVRVPEHHTPTLTPIAVYGFLGVQLFFMISGFVICMSSWGRGLGAFMTSRVSRLYPAYWLAVLATAVVVNLVPLTAGVNDRAVPTWRDTLLNLTMLHQPLGVTSVDSVYWTLFVELRFYLLFAVVVWFGVTYRRVLMFCALWLALAVLAPLLQLPALDALVQPPYAPFFVAGMVMYLIHRFGPNPVLYGLVALCWAWSIHLVADRLSRIELGGQRISLWPGYVVITLSFAVLMVIALRWTDGVRWHWLTVAGALTYPLYLIHQRIGYVVMRSVHEAAPWLPVWSLIAGMVLVMMLLSYLIYRLFERPVSRWLRHGMNRGLAQIRRESAAEARPVVMPRPRAPEVPEPAVNPAR